MQPRARPVHALHRPLSLSPRERKSRCIVCNPSDAREQGRPASRRLDKSVERILPALTTAPFARKNFAVAPVKFRAERNVANDHPSLLTPFSPAVSGCTRESFPVDLRVVQRRRILSLTFSPNSYARIFARARNLLGGGYAHSVFLNQYLRWARIFVSFCDDESMFVRYPPPSEGGDPRRSV